MQFAPKKQPVIEREHDHARDGEKPPIGRVFGRSGTRPNETRIRTTNAIRNRMPANEIGGRSARPSLIASQVELQTRQSVR